MRRTYVLALLILLCVWPAVSRAHHSGSEYDRTAPIEIVGQLVEVAWQNPHVHPHVHFLVRTTDPSGKTVTWDIEANSLSILRRTDATPENLKVGDTIKVAGAPSRRAPNRMWDRPSPRRWPRPALRQLRSSTLTPRERVRWPVALRHCFRASRSPWVPPIPPAATSSSNATSTGTYDDDPMPVDVDRVEQGAWVGDVVLAREMTPFLVAAQARRCRVQTGADMLFEQIPAYLEFFGFPSTSAAHLRQLEVRPLIR